MKLLHFAYIIFAGALLSSCHIWGSYERSSQVDSLAHAVNYRGVDAADTINFGQKPWQEVFTDVQLQALINKVLEQNADMKVAQMNCEMANVGLKVSKFQMWLPTIAFQPSGTISRVFMDGMQANKTYEFPIQASWQIDAFAKQRNAMMQSKMKLLTVKEATQATQTALIATTAQLYYGLQLMDEQLATTQATLALWEKNIKALEAMKQAGMINQSALSSAKAQYLQIQGTVPQLEESIRSLENNLCQLMLEAPHAIERGKFAPKAFPFDMRTGMPFQLLSQRPDVRIAELELANCFYAKLGARSAFYPTLTIAGSGAFTNSLGSMIVNPGKFIAAGVANLVQPILARGALVGQLKVSKIAEKQAEVKFEKTLLGAAMEVSNAVSKYNSYTQQEALTRQRVAELEKANMVTHELFLHAGGTTTYLETLTAEMQLLQGQLTLLNDQYQQVLAAINLYQALGGGRPTPEPLP